MMKQTVSAIIFTMSALPLLSSCSNSDDILKALNIDSIPEKEKRAADQKTIDDLNKQLAVARSNETTLTRKIADLEKKLDQQDAAVAEQISAVREALEEQQLALTEEIETLKKEISEQEMIISIQGKVIGLLDDADKSLQRSIQKQIDENKN
ncbi:MAG: hypothetical protein P8X39_02090 [Desulfofustis sp.]|jgi:predicted  nucleic acid-binding Zn-ribbon protein